MKESPGRKIREGRWESMTIRYQPRGVCARQFEIQAEDGIIQSVQVTGGCSGNLQGISSLLKGMPNYLSTVSHSSTWTSSTKTGRANRLS